MFQINMKVLNSFFLTMIIAVLLTQETMAQTQIGVASAVNKNTTDLTLEQERKLIDAGYEIIQNHTIETDGIGRAQMLLLRFQFLLIQGQSHRLEFLQFLSLRLRLLH